MKTKTKRVLSLVGALLFFFSLNALANSNAKGIDYYRAGFFDAANMYFDQLTNQTSLEQAEKFYYQGLIALEQEDKAKAHDLFEKSAAADDNYFLGYVAQGKIELLNGNERAAEDYFKKAASKAKKDPSGQTAIAEAYLEANMLKKVEDALEQANKAKKNYSGIFIVRGDMLLKEGKVGEACAMYEQAILFDRTDKIAYLKLARAYRNVNPPLALSFLDRLLEIDSEYIPAYSEIGNINYSIGQYGKAIEAYQKVINIPGIPIKNLESYAQLLYFTQRYEESLAQIEELLKKDPDNFVLQRLKAYNNFELKNYEAGLPAFKKLLETTDPTQHISQDYLTLGRYYVALKQYPEAIEALTKAETMDNARLGDIYKELATAYSSERNYEQAMIYRGKYIDAVGEDVVSMDYFTYGQACYSYAVQYLTKRAEENITPEEKAAYTDTLKVGINKSLEAFGTVIERLPESYLGYLWSANASSILDNVENTDTGTMSGHAKPFFEKAIELMLARNEDGSMNRSLITAYDYLSNYYFVQEDNDKVAEYNKRILELDPANERSKTILDALGVKY